VAVRILGRVGLESGVYQESSHRLDGGFAHSAFMEGFDLPDGEAELDIFRYAGIVA